MFFKKKGITFDKAAKFNYELDTNEKLKETLCNLSLSRNKMKREKYLSKIQRQIVKCTHILWNSA